MFIDQAWMAVDLHPKSTKSYIGRMKEDLNHMWSDYFHNHTMYPLMVTHSYADSLEADGRSNGTQVTTQVYLEGILLGNSWYCYFIA